MLWLLHYIRQNGVNCTWLHETAYAETQETPIVHLLSRPKLCYTQAVVAVCGSLLIYDIITNFFAYLHRYVQHAVWYYCVCEHKQQRDHVCTDRRYSEIYVRAQQAYDLRVLCALN